MTGNTLHIVHGDTGADKAWLERAARTRKAGRWMVPKFASVGDELVIYVGAEFFATARVISEPRPRTDWRNRYGARIDHVRLINPGISIGVIRNVIPALKWAKYPRSITTPPMRVAEKIRSLVENRRNRHGADVISSAPEILSDEELRQLAILCGKKRLDRKMRTVAYRQRSKIIHRHVLRRASGFCEGCGQDAPFKRKDGSPYLEPHHTQRVADDGPDHPGTIIALCPTCHRRVHHAYDREKYNQALIGKLMRLEPRIAS